MPLLPKMRLLSLSICFCVVWAASAQDQLTARMPHQAQQDTFSQAHAFLEDLKQAPSCHRLAAAVLIDSCKTLEPDKNANIALDRIKSSFAARLAVCELLGAHAAVPQQCAAMVPRPQDRDRKGLKCYLPGLHCSYSPEDASTAATEYASVDQAQISECLNALESRPQWWMSYSNARQNAISICHAARSEVEREDILEVHRSMTSMTSDLSATLSQRIKDSQEQASQHHAFATTLRNLQEKLTHDIETSHEKANSRFTSFLADVESRFSSLFTAAFKSIAETDKRIKSTADTAAHSSREMDAARKKLGTIVQDISSGASAISSAQSKALTTQQQLTQSLETLQQRDVNSLLAAFTQLQTELRASSQLMALVVDKQLSHEEWLAGLNGALDNLMLGMLSMKETQEAQAANQSAMVEHINTKIENLGVAIDEKTEAVKGLQVFGDLGGITKLLVAGVILLAALHFHPGIAAAIALVLGGGYLVATLELREKMRIGVDEGPIRHAAGMLLEYWPALLPLMAIGSMGAMALLRSWKRRVKSVEPIALL